MTTRNLLWWLALLGGSELALQGHLGNQAAFLHGGAWLAIAALVSAAWQAQRLRRIALVVAAGVPFTISLLAALGLPAEPADPLADFWRGHTSDRETLTRVAKEETLTLFGEEVALDRHGFRAQPAAPDAAYRIVAIGGSSTFGARPEDGLPWPALLEQRIATLGCALSVAVFNAGRTGRGIAAAVRGFDSEIAPLRPDLVLVYPGPADVFAVGRAAPAGIGVVVPLPARASSLLRRIELGWRVRDVEDRFRQALMTDPPALETHAIPLATSYRSLLVKTRSRGIDAALATVSLAVNGDSPEFEIRRYEAHDPRTRHAVLANRLHDRLVRQLGAAFRATLVDTHAGLDGAGSDAFLDLFHLTREGRELLAGNLLDGLRSKLARQRRLGCPPA